MSERTPLVICLVGFSGVGKLTIATILARLRGARVIDNHWINDPILRIVASDGSAAVPEAVWPQVAKVREAVLETVATLAPASDSFIFTLAGADEDPDDRRLFEQYRNVALRRRARLIVIRLLCREEELVKRIQGPERRGRKLTDPGEAITNVRNYTPLNPSVPGVLSIDVNRAFTRGRRREGFRAYQLCRVNHAGTDNSTQIHEPPLDPIPGATPIRIAVSEQRGDS